MEKSDIYDKPFKNYEEMIKIMESRNIIVENKSFAMSALQNFSYYGLINGYKNTFLQKAESDLFQKGTHFEELYTLHLIDTSLNSILFKYILYLEKALKSRLSYRVSEYYGVYTDKDDFSFTNTDDYLCRRNYSNKSGRRYNILLSLKKCISREKNNPIMIHYLDERNHVPPWILTTNISYGLAIEWYNILRGDDKTAICDSFIPSGLLKPDETKEFIRKIFELTKEYRNKIAHGNRTFSILNLPQLPKHQLLTLSFHFISEEEYNHRIGQNDTLAILLAIIIALRDPYMATSLVGELKILLLPYSQTSFNGYSVFKLLGFPENVFDRFNNLLQQLYT